MGTDQNAVQLIASPDRGSTHCTGRDLERWRNVKATTLFFFGISALSPASLVTDLSVVEQPNRWNGIPHRYHEVPTAARVHFDRTSYVDDLQGSADCHTPAFSILKASDSAKQRLSFGTGNFAFIGKTYKRRFSSAESRSLEACN